MRCIPLLLLVPLLLAADAPSDRVRKHLGEPVVAMLQQVERVEAFRVDQLDAKQVGDAGHVAARKIVGQAVEVPPPQRDRLLAALLDDRTYFSSDSKGTKTGVGLRLWTKDKQCLEVSYCLAKGNVWITAKDAAGKVVAQGDRRGFREDKANPLRVISAELFPNDAEVQKLRPSAEAIAARPTTAPVENKATENKTADKKPAATPRTTEPRPATKPASAEPRVEQTLPPVLGDQVLSVAPGPEQVDFQIFIPVEAKPVRGVLVHAAHYTLKTDDRWAELCRELGFAHVALNINLKQSNRPQKLGRALLAGLVEVSKKASLPELATCPLCGVGHSAGGMVIGALHEAPERLLTTCVDCAWVSDPAKWPASAAAAPALFTMGAVPDGFKMLPSITEFYEPARKQGLPWAMGVQWGCAHDFANAGTLQAIWIRSVARKRLPTGNAMVPSRQDDAWLGDRCSTSGRFATVAAFADYAGDKSAASWFPDRESAFIWRAWQTKESLITVEAATTQGDQKLPPFDVKKSRGMTVARGDSVKLSVAGKNLSGVRAVTWYDGDRPVAKASSAPWQADWKELAPGVHALWASWEDDSGKPNATNPALVVVRHH